MKALLVNIDSVHFVSWLTEDYRMHEEEFDGLDVEDKIKIIDQYEDENRP